MLAWTGNGVVILLLIGVLLQEVSRVEGLRCYKCGEDEGGCTHDELKGKDDECNKNSNETERSYICSKSGIKGNAKAVRSCVQASMSEVKLHPSFKDGCVELIQPVRDTNITTETCFCDTDLCNGNGPKSPGPKSAGAPSTLITTVALIFSLAVICTVTTHGSFD